MEILNYIKDSINLFLKRDNGYEKIEDYSIKEPLIVIITLTLLTNLFASIINFWITDSEKSKIYLITTQTLLNTFSITAGLLLGAIITYYFLRLFKGKSDMKNTIKYFISILILPTLILIIPQIIFLIIYAETTQIIWNLTNILIISIYLILTLTITIISFIKNLQILSKLHEISKLKVFLSFLIPAILALVLLFGLLILIILYVPPQLIYV